MLPEMELTETDFLEDGENTETKWLAKKNKKQKTSVDVKTKFLAEIHFLYINHSLVGA